MRLPEAISNEEELDAYLRKLRWFINQEGEYEWLLARVERFLRWYQRTEFKGRYKTNETLFYERARVILIRSIYDKSKSKRKPDSNRNLLGRVVFQKVH